MDKLLLLGDEAIAQGAVDAGISGVFAYPGTPSTEITNTFNIQKRTKSDRLHPHGRPIKKRPWKPPLACRMPANEH